MSEMWSLPNELLNRFDSKRFGVRWREEAPYKSVDVDHATEWMNGIAKSRGVGNITQNDGTTLK